MVKIIDRCDNEKVRMKKSGGVAIKLLQYAALGGAIYFSLQNTRMAKELYKYLKQKIHKQNLRRSLVSLKKQNLINLKETSEGYKVQITKNGSIYLSKLSLDNLSLKRPKRWDGKWRLVMFDIPEGLKKERDFFAKKLKDLGFFPLQHSVFVFPHDCKTEIDFVVKVCCIDKYVKYGVLTEISDEGIILKCFSLKK